MSVKIDNEKCTGCGVCIDSCPVSALELKDGIAVVSDDCTECGICISECPTEAISQ
jgi:ferredoxin